MGSVRWTQPPEVPCSAHDEQFPSVGNFIGLVIPRVLAFKSQDALLDLPVVKADRLEVELEVELGENLQVLPEELIIPSAQLREAVVCDHETTELILRKVAHAQRGDAVDAEELTRLDPCMA